MNKSLGVTIAAAIVGAALALILKHVLFPTPPLTGPCSSGQDHCKVVRVITVAGQPQIQAISDERFTAAGVMFWEIETAGYTFPAKGIDFYPATTTKLPATAAPAGEFFNCNPMPGNTVYKCNDKYTPGGPPGPFGYTVTLDGSPAVAPLDPYILNN
jgi:hypothetical protein